MRIVAFKHFLFTPPRPRCSRRRRRRRQGAFEALKKLHGKGTDRQIDIYINSMKESAMRRFFENRAEEGSQSDMPHKQFADCPALWST